MVMEVTVTFNDMSVKWWWSVLLVEETVEIVTFNDMSVKSWWSVLLVEETVENH
jgi:hypothetical protein